MSAKPSTSDAPPAQSSSSTPAITISDVLSTETTPTPPPARATFPTALTEFAEDYVAMRELIQEHGSVARAAEHFRTALFPQNTPNTGADLLQLRRDLANSNRERDAARDQARRCLDWMEQVAKLSTDTIIPNLFRQSSVADKVIHHLDILRMEPPAPDYGAVQLFATEGVARVATVMDSGRWLPYLAERYRFHRGNLDALEAELASDGKSFNLMVGGPPGKAAPTNSSMEPPTKKARVMPVTSPTPDEIRAGTSPHVPSYKEMLNAGLRSFLTLMNEYAASDLRPDEAPPLRTFSDRYLQPPSAEEVEDTTNQIDLTQDGDEESKSDTAPGGTPPAGGRNTWTPAQRQAWAERGTTPDPDTWGQVTAPRAHEILDGIPTIKAVPTTENPFLLMRPADYLDYLRAQPWVQMYNNRVRDVHVWVDGDYTADQLAWFQDYVKFQHDNLQAIWERRHWLPLQKTEQQPRRLPSPSPFWSSIQSGRKNRASRYAEKHVVLTARFRQVFFDGEEETDSPIEDLAIVDPFMWSKTTNPCAWTPQYAPLVAQLPELHAAEPARTFWINAPDRHPWNHIPAEKPWAQQYTRVVRIDPPAGTPDVINPKPDSDILKGIRSIDDPEDTE